MKKSLIKFLQVTREPQITKFADLASLDGKQQIATVSSEVIDHLRATVGFLTVDFSDVVLCDSDGALSSVVTGEPVDAAKGAEFYDKLLSDMVTALDTDQKAEVYKFILNGCRAKPVVQPKAAAGTKQTRAPRSGVKSPEEQREAVKALILECVTAGKLPSLSPANKVDDPLLSSIVLSSTPEAKKLAREVWGELFDVPEGEKSIDNRAIPSNYGALKSNEAKREDYINSLKDHLSIA